MRVGEQVDGPAATVSEPAAHLAHPDRPPHTDHLELGAEPSAQPALVATVVQTLPQSRAERRRSVFVHGDVPVSARCPRRVACSATSLEVREVWSPHIEARRCAVWRCAAGRCPAWKAVAASPRRSHRAPARSPPYPQKAPVGLPNGMDPLAGPVSLTTSGLAPGFLRQPVLSCPGVSFRGLTRSVFSASRFGVFSRTVRGAVDRHGSHSWVSAPM